METLFWINEYRWNRWMDGIYGVVCRILTKYQHTINDLQSDVSCLCYWATAVETKNGEVKRKS